MQAFRQRAEDLGLQLRSLPIHAVFAGVTHDAGGCRCFEPLQHFADDSKTGVGIVDDHLDVTAAAIQPRPATYDLTHAEPLEFFLQFIFVVASTTGVSTQLLEENGELGPSRFRIVFHEHLPFQTYFSLAIIADAVE